jgi:hypothetical protein
MGTEHTEERPAPLRGYRELNEEEKSTLDAIKLLEVEIGKLWAWVYSNVESADALRYALRAEGLFRDGFMNLIRAVARPYDPYREALAEMKGDSEHEPDLSGGNRG